MLARWIHGGGGDLWLSNIAMVAMTSVGAVMTAFTMMAVVTVATLVATLTVGTMATLVVTMTVLAVVTVIGALGDGTRSRLPC